MDVPDRTTHVPRPLKVLSILLVATHVGMTWNYVDPRFVPRPLGPGQVSILRYIDSMGPIWAAAFALTGVAIAATLWLYPRCLRWGHAIGATVMTTYCAASWIGAWVSQPPAPIMTAVLASAVAATHFVATWVAARAVR